MTSLTLPSAAAASPDAAGSAALESSRARLLAAVGASIAAGVGLLLAGKGTPLVHLGTAAFLSLVVFDDVRRMRIPNALTFPALALALAASALSGGLAGLAGALLGVLVALALGIGPYALGWLGAGDVKALFVVGALQGARVLPVLFLWMILAGGVLALAYLIARGGLADLLRRWWLSAATTVTTRRLHYFSASRGSAAAAGLPFGLAMAAGAIAHSLWENLA